MGKEIVSIKVDGMDCNNCAMSIARYLERKGMEEVFVSFQTKEVRYLENDKKLTETQVKSAITKLGYQVIEAETPPVFWTLNKKLLISAIFTIPLMATHFLMMAGMHSAVLENPWTQLLLCLPPFIIGSWHFGKSAISSLKGGVPNMDVLIFIGSTAAFIYSLIGLILGNPDYYFFETTATIITLVLLGNYLEHRAVEQTTSAIGELTKLQVEKALRVMKSSTLIEIEKDDIKKGMILQVNEGDKIPADGKIIKGTGQIDESMLTGESLPVDKAIGSEVIGASILQSGSLQIEVLAVGADSVLQQMIELVKTAQQDKPPIQRLADKISAIFVPLVVGISLLTFVIAYFGFGISGQQAFLNAIAVLVISCPCAMGLATPTAVMVGVGRLAKNGVLIKGGTTLEQLAEIKQIVFDKTGTLTTGAFRVESTNYLVEDQALINTLVWEMEQHSSHPIAVSMRKAVEKLPRTDTLSSLKITEEKGIGMKAIDEEGIIYLLGSKRILNEDQTSEGDVFLTKNGKLIASFTIGDDLKPDLKQVIQKLKNFDINTSILSGDRQEKTAKTAEILGIKTYYAEQLPKEKLEIIRSLTEKSPTAMIGDGINDAPALTQASLGISLSNASQVAIQSAKVVLLNGRLDVLPKAISIAKHTVLTIKQSLFWAFSYNIVAIPLAAFGFLNPMWAALFMAFSDIVVIGNSIRLKFKKV